MGKSKAAVPRASNKAAPPSNAFTQLYKAYISETPSHFKLIDAFLLFLFVTGVLQFVYCVVLSDYPFNSFLAGFAATVCLLYTSPSPRDRQKSRMPSSA